MKKQKESGIISLRTPIEFREFSIYQFINCNLRKVTPMTWRDLVNLPSGLSPQSQLGDGSNSDDLTVRLFDVGWPLVWDNFKSQNSLLVTPTLPDIILHV